METDFSQFEWTRYWFMFPVSICIATTAMLSGIGGAAIFTPVFIIIFPLLGAEYPIASTAAAISTALFTQLFGFSSGFVGYLRQGLIDFYSARKFLAVGVPLGIIGAIVLGRGQVDEDLIKAGYAILMVVLAYWMISHHHCEVAGKPTWGTGGSVSATAIDGRMMRTITARNGKVYTFREPRHGFGAIATSAGAFLTGLLSVGIGEVVMPQLTKRNHVPIPVAAATSVFIVIVVVATASFTQISTLIAEGGLAAMPWNVVCYTIPGVIIGGQIEPRLQQGAVARHKMELGIGTLFVVIAVCMGWIAVKNLLLS